MHNEALGMIETFGYIGAVEALDVCLKSANVEFSGCELVGGGLVTIEITGDVAAVNAAIETARIAVQKVAKLISTFVIPRPVDEVFEVFCKNIKTEDSNENNPVNIIMTEQSDKQSKKNKLVPDDNTEKSEIIKAPQKKKEVNKQNGNESFFKMRQKLEKMKVVELRNLARQLNLSSITKKDIKFGKKKQLINAILDFYKRRLK